jgi:hypothetical protein
MGSPLPANFEQFTTRALENGLLSPLSVFTRHRCLRMENPHNFAIR